jgi:hypothetical protein
MASVKDQKPRMNDVEMHSSHSFTKQHRISQKQEFPTQPDIDLRYIGSWAESSEDLPKTLSRTISINDIVLHNAPEEVSNMKINSDDSTYNLQRWLQQTYSDPFIPIGISFPQVKHPANYEG